MPGPEQMAKLVARAQQGDMDAFNELYNVSSKELETVGYSILRKKEDVEDALQETFITIYRSMSGQGIAPIKDPEKFLPWAKRIMRNTCLTQIDHKKRKAGKDELRPMNSSEDHEGLDTIDNVDDDRDFSPEDAAEAEYIRSLISKVMDGIPAIRQTCLALHQQGLSYHEIGQQLSIPEGTAKSHVRYARLQLQKAVKEIEEREQVEVHGFIIIPVSPDKFVPLCRVTRKEEEAAAWIAADTAGVVGAASLKHAVPRTAIGKKIAAIALAAVIAAGAAVFGVSESRQHNTPSTRSPVTQTIQNGKRQEQKSEEESDRRMDVAPMYKMLNERRENAAKQENAKGLRDFKRSSRLEKIAEQHAKRYAELDDDYQADNREGGMFEDPVTSKTFELPELAADGLTSPTLRTVGIGCYENNGTYYWVIVYGE